MKNANLLEFQDQSTRREIAMRSVNPRAFFEWKGRQECAARAMAKPLPGAAADAILSGNTKVGDVVVQKVQPVHIAYLQELASPLLQLAENASKSKEKKDTQDFRLRQQREVCYIFTEDPELLFDSIDTSTVEEKKNKANAFVKNWDAAKVNMVILAIIEQFHRHIKSTIRFATEVQSQGDASFFRELQASFEKPPESAGS